MLMLCIFTSRCVSVCCADLLPGLVVHLPVYPGSHVSVLSQTAPRKRYRVSLVFPLAILSLLGQHSTLQINLLFFFFLFSFSHAQQAIYWSSVQKAGTVDTALENIIAILSLKCQLAS